MLNLLTADKIKLLRGKMLWIVLGILSLLPLLQAANSKMTVHYGVELVQAIDTVVNGATGILMIEKNGLTILLVICAFVSFFVGEEFHHGTIRNALSLGRSRTHYYLSKLAIAALLSFFGTLFMTALGMASFTAAFGFGEAAGISRYFHYALQTFGTLYVLILANVSIYVMIGFLAKNSGVSLIWNFLYTIGTGFGAGIFQQTKHFKYLTYWFTESFLFYSDFAKPSDIAKYPEMLLVSLLTIMVSSALGIFLFTRTDIKWGWIFVFLTLALFLYLYFLKRELRKLKHTFKSLPARSGYGSRLSLDFRDKALMDLVDEWNQMINAFEDKNRQAKKMEENVMLSIAGLSHDLRTPLTSINGYVQLLHANADETKTSHYLTMIEHSVKRLIEMTDHFYELARIDTNQKELALSSLSLPNLTEEIFLSFYEQFEETNIELQFPEQIQDSPVIADQFLLVRVIQNVVQNILRYANSKAVIRYRKEEKHLIFSVANDIKPDSKVAIEKVFMRFYSEVASRTNTEASGLGLYLSKKLVEKMNGKMDAELRDHWFILSIRLPVQGR